MMVESSPMTKRRRKVTPSAPIWPIMQQGHPALRRVCSVVPDLHDLASRREVHAIAQNLVVAMVAHRGVGLAAPQIGVMLRMAVICPNPDKADNLSVLVNPELTFEDEEDEVDDLEGCLSLTSGGMHPGFTVRRHESLAMHYEDLHGDAHEVDSTGWEARVIQHEVDHLDGTTIFDRSPGPEKMTWLQLAGDLPAA